MLTRDQIDDLAEDGVFLGNVYEIAEAIEAEVRKDYDALIQQMHDAMSNLTTLCLSGGSPLFTAEFDRLIEATTTARTRLE